MRVLLVDNDPGTLEVWQGVLRLSGYDVSTAERGSDGIAVALVTKPDVILVDLRLPDTSALDFLRSLREHQLQMPVVIADIQSAVTAIKLGAVDYVLKPLIGEAVVKRVELELSARPNVDAGGDAPQAHASSRWAQAVGRIVEAPRDPKTIEEWGRLLGVSAGALKNWCRTAGLSPKRSLDLGRLLRAVVRYHRSGIRPEDSLDVVDRRTLKRLLSVGGADVPAASLPERVDALLDAQVLIGNATALSELKRNLHVIVTR
jgi:ActR/RegA family two-component response regulator